MLHAQLYHFMATPPVLLLAFNRPDLTRRVFEVIREAKPSLFFLAVDGPRANKPGEAELNREIRSLAGEVDWPCEVHTRFIDENLGCKRAVSGAIDWFFEHVEEGIILEDDCLPHASFFSYCAAMLEHYRDDPSIGMISGDNFRPQSEWSPEGHGFSIFTFIWGWATWRRAWRHYDADIYDWQECKRSGWLRDLFRRPEAVTYWTDVFDRCHSGQINSWDYSWSYSCWRAGFLSVIPGCNLVTNIGFGERSTHTKEASHHYSQYPVREISQPLKALSDKVRDRSQEEQFLRDVYNVRLHSMSKRLRRSFRKWSRRLVKNINQWTLPLAGRGSRLRRQVDLLKISQRFLPGCTRLDGMDWSYPDAVSFSYAYEQIFLRGVYDIGASARPTRILDCGANVGLATLYWKKRYPDVEVIAVEADPEIFKYLVDNINCAGVTGVHVLNQAVWHSAGELSFAPQGADGGCLHDTRDKTPSRTIRVPAVPLGDLIGDAPLDLLKIDIEGAECDVLIGQEDVLGPVERIFVEYHSYVKKEQRVDELLSLLRRAGFRLHIHPELVSPRPFVKKLLENGMDHRLNIYAWREHV
jgi:FkbM family methyltransferase